MTAVHTNDVVPLLSSSCLGKFCENVPMKIISITPLTKLSRSNYYRSIEQMQI